MNSHDYVFEEKQNRKEMFNSQVHSLNLKDSSSTRQFSQVKSQDNLHVLKLESKALELLRKLQHQKFQIVTLTDETQKLMKKCDEQKSYLKTVNVDMMKQEYQEEVHMLSEEREKLLSLIMSLKEQKALWHQEKQQKLNTARYENQILSEKIEKALLQKQELLKIAAENKLLKEKRMQKIAQQEETLDELRHVQRKVVISLKELQELRKKQNQL